MREYWCRNSPVSRTHWVILWLFNWRKCNNCPKGQCLDYPYMRARATTGEDNGPSL